MKKKKWIFPALAAALMLAGCVGHTNINPQSSTATAQTTSVPATAPSQSMAVSDAALSAASGEGAAPAGQTPGQDMEQNAQQLLERAKTLTRHLVKDAFPQEAAQGFATPEKLAASEEGRTIYRFLYAQYHYFDDPTDPYYGLFDPKADLTEIEARMPLDKAQRIVEQVFGVEDWFPEFAQWDFDQQTQCFCFPLEVGPFSVYDAKDLTAQQRDDQTIVVTLRLTDSDLAVVDAPMQDYGSYQLIYQLQTDGDAQFLRFQSFLPC